MNKNYFRNKSLLITGGTGSFGKAFVNYIIKNRYPLKKLIIFSRDELKQFEMNQVFSDKKYPFLRYFIGDVRDKDRLKLAFRNVDIIIHAAALKQVPTAEYNPIEFIKTNIIGAQNIIESTLDTEISCVVALSTDKASSPINLYGATKLCSDKLFVSANNIRGTSKIKYTIVRYGNVMGSRGSVLHTLLKDRSSGTFKLTDLSMTRFNISLLESIEMVLWTIQTSIGGEVFVPKLKSYYLKDLAKAVSSECKMKSMGIRPGEKIHEEMISVYDSRMTVDLGNYYAILNENILPKYLKKGYQLVEKDFVYRSDSNNEFLSIPELRKMLKEFM